MQEKSHKFHKVVSSFSGNKFVLAIDDETDEQALEAADDDYYAFESDALAHGEAMKARGECQKYRVVAVF